MPCFILTGCPCVGKTTFSQLLGERAKQHKSGSIRRVVIVNEESACPDFTKAQCYANSNAEKKTRAALKADFDRAVASNSKNKDTLVILDSMNYIKGYRYELHCISKAAGERHGVVWILNDAQVAKDWNSSRLEGGFADQVMEELEARYEPPDARNRWDKPLYRINVTPKGSGTTTSAAQDALQRSVYNMHSLSDAMTTTTDDVVPSKKSAASSFKRAGFRRATPTQQTAKEGPATSNNSNSPAPAQLPAAQTKAADNAQKEAQKELSLEERIDEMLDSFLLDVQPLKEGLSTRQQVTAEANVLHEADSITQQVCSSIMSAQKMSSVTGGRISIPVGDETVTMELRRTISLAELKRLRRQYIRWVASHPPEDASEHGIVTSFVAYIEVQM